MMSAHFSLCSVWNFCRKKTESTHASKKTGFLLLTDKERAKMMTMTIIWLNLISWSSFGRSKCSERTGGSIFLSNLQNRPSGPFFKLKKMRMTRKYCLLHDRTVCMVSAGLCSPYVKEKDLFLLPVEWQTLVEDNKIINSASIGTAGESKANAM